MSSPGESASAFYYVARYYEAKHQQKPRIGSETLFLNRPHHLSDQILPKTGLFNQSEPQSSVNILLKELTLIVASRKSDQYGASVSILDKYTADTVPTHLLRSETGLVRRLAAVLLAFIFQNKNEILTLSTRDPRENVCMLQNFLFLNPYKSAMKEFSPKPYEYVSKPIFYYLPRSQFPEGLPSFLDVEKMYSILVTKEYLRIPDPSEMIIWLPLEIEFDNGSACYDTPLQLNNRSLWSSREEGETPFLNSSHCGDESRHHPRPYGHSNKLMEEPLELPSASRRRSPRNQKEGGESPTLREDLSSGIPHRVKCFQFFKKVSPNQTKVKQEDSKNRNIRKESDSLTFLPTATTKTSISSINESFLESNPTSIAQEVRDWVTVQDYNYFVSSTHNISLREVCLSQTPVARSQSNPKSTNQFKLSLKPAANACQQTQESTSNRPMLSLSPEKASKPRNRGSSVIDCVPMPYQTKEPLPNLSKQDHQGTSSSIPEIDSCLLNSPPKKSRIASRSSLCLELVSSQQQSPAGIRNRSLGSAKKLNIVAVSQIRHKPTVSHQNKGDVELKSVPSKVIKNNGHTDVHNELRERSPASRNKTTWVTLGGTNLLEAGCGRLAENDGTQTDTAFLKVSGSFRIATKQQSHTKWNVSSSSCRRIANGGETCISKSPGIRDPTASDTYIQKKSPQVQQVSSPSKTAEPKKVFRVSRAEESKATTATETR